MRKTTKIVGGAAVGLAAAAATFASAQFILSSTGDATGQVATPNIPSVAGTIQGDLWPGECNDVQAVFQNTNADHAVTITNVYGLPDSTTSALDTNLLAANHHVGGSVPGAPGVTFSDGATVAPGASTTITLKDGVCLSPAADDQHAGRDTAFKLFVTSNVVAGSEFDTATH